MAEVVVVVENVGAECTASPVVTLTSAEWGAPSLHDNPLSHTALGDNYDKAGANHAGTDGQLYRYELDTARGRVSDRVKDALPTRAFRV